MKRNDHIKTSHQNTLPYSVRDNLKSIKESKVKSLDDPDIPLVVCPLGIEPKKPRGLWDGRYVNEYCRDIPFSMDNAAKVAEVSWINAYLFKLDH